MTRGHTSRRRRKKKKAKKPRPHRFGQFDLRGIRVVEWLIPIDEVEPLPKRNR